MESTFSLFCNFLFKFYGKVYDGENFHLSFFFINLHWAWIDIHFDFKWFKGNFMLNNINRVVDCVDLFSTLCLKEKQTIIFFWVFNVLISIWNKCILITNYLPECFFFLFDGITYFTYKFLWFMWCRNQLLGRWSLQPGCDD